MFSISEGLVEKNGWDKQKLASNTKPFISLSNFYSNWKPTGSLLRKFKECRQAVISWREKSVGNVSLSSSLELCPSLTPIIIRVYFAAGMSGVIGRTWTCEYTEEFSLHFDFFHLIYSAVLLFNGFFILHYLEKHMEQVKSCVAL